VASSRPSPRPWSTRWHQLARAAGIAPEERLLLALSGGADSVLLLHLVAHSVPRPALRACHVDHGLRGAESRADADFCENLCRSLDVPFGRVEVELDPNEPSLEARARRARYGALLAEAERSGHPTILTGHHSDDALETVLLRWVRGTGLPGLRGARRELVPGAALHGGSAPSSAVRVVRPLLPLRREEVRRLLADRGLAWREDSSNQDPRFTRNRVRNEFLPFLERTLGAEGIENLRSFGQAVEALEEKLAGATAHLAWRTPSYASASRGPAEAGLGGVLLRSELMQLATPLRRRALWRLLTEGTGVAPGRALLAAVLQDLATGRCTRRSLCAGWSLVLRSSELQLVPTPKSAREASTAPSGRQEACLPFPLGGPLEGGEAPRARSPRDLGFRETLDLAVPGILSLPDGRRISAERVRMPARIPTPETALEVELDAVGLPGRLRVRWAESGDRFHALGAPGSKSLRRFLADRGVPREERGSVPIVMAGDEIVWVAGVEPAERHRVRPETYERLRLTLHADAPVRPC